MTRPRPVPAGRRRALGLLAGGAALPFLGGCRDENLAGIDVAGTLPDLAFSLTRAADGAEVTEAAYRGQVTALFFGYTYCPDVCPMTLANLTQVTRKLGDRAAGFSILFVTVDPDRDTRQVLARYVDAFTPRATGLRGTDNQLASVARRYRVTYSVSEVDGETRVTHGPSVYLFDRSLAGRVMLPDFDTAGADIDGVTEDISRLLAA